MLYEVITDLVELDALVDGLVGAFGFAHIAVDAFFGDLERQGLIPFRKNASAWPPGPPGRQIPTRRHSGVPLP